MRGGKRATATVAILIAVAVTSCSSSGDGLPMPPETASETTTQATTSPTTETTLATTTTTLSEQELAEAEIEQLAIDWFHSPYDTSKGEEELGLDYLTGLVAQRFRESTRQLTDQGLISRNREPGRIIITDVQVDLAQGQGEVWFCAASSGETLDAETLEVIEAEDPDYATTSRVLVELTPDGWKIYELYASQATTEPEACDLTTGEAIGNR